MGQGMKLVLAGNPNVGKSVVFNYLTGLYVDVSNFSGTTVDISSGKFGEYTVIDTPGVYGVSSFNDEERVAREIIMEADILLNIVDATHLERDLFLTQQLIDMGKQVVMGLNMLDEADKSGISIDVEKLSNELGIEVLPMSAVDGKGLSKLKELLEKGKVGRVTREVENCLASLCSEKLDRAEALLVLEQDETTLKKYNLDSSHCCREYIYRARRKKVDSIFKSVVSQSEGKLSLSEGIGNMMIRPITGIPILLGTLFAMYQVLGVFVAQTVVGITEDTVMNGYYHRFIERIMGDLFSEGSLIGELLLGEFGILTMVPIYMIGLLLPLVVGFYFFLSFLEDSGYLPRIAVLVDRVLTKIGLNGRAVIPMILGLGCVTMAIITTRLLGSRREKFIATMILGLAVPCSAQLGVIMGLIAPLGFGMFMLYIGVILGVLILTGTLLNKIMPGKSSALFIDLPPLRLPKMRNISRKTFSKSLMFLKEATPLFVIGAFLITVMQYTGLLEVISKAISTFTVGFLKLPAETSQAFIMGIVRRDFGAAGLNDLVSRGLMTGNQIVVALVAITLFVPCIAAVMVIFKERSLKESMTIWVSSFVLAFLVSGALAQIIV